MSTETPSRRRGPSRRRVLKHGLLATTGALVGGSWSVAAERGAPESDEPTSRRGAMFPYQFAPAARFTVREAGLEWRPERVDQSYTTHVIEYEHARSVRAFLFTDEALPADRDRSFAFESGPGAPPSGADRRLVGVTVESDG